MTDLVTALSKDLRTKLRNEPRFFGHIVGATDEAFRMLQMIADHSLRGFNEFPEGRTVLVYWSGSDDGRTRTIVRMNTNPNRFNDPTLFMDFCDGEFVVVKMMD